MISLLLNSYGVGENAANRMIGRSLSAGINQFAASFFAAEVLMTVISDECINNHSPLVRLSLSSHRDLSKQ